MATSGLRRKPRGMKKPPYAPTAPAMPMQPGGGLAGRGEPGRVAVGPAPEDGRDHPVGRAVADAGRRRTAPGSRRRTGRSCAAEARRSRPGRRAARTPNEAMVILAPPSRSATHAAERPGERADEGAQEREAQRRVLAANWVLSRVGKAPAIADERAERADVEEGHHPGVRVVRCAAANARSRPSRRIRLSIRATRRAPRSGSAGRTSSPAAAAPGARRRRSR